MIYQLGGGLLAVVLLGAGVAGWWHHIATGLGAILEPTDSVDWDLDV